MKTLLIAHKGDTVNFKENTLEAFASAFNKGADGIELDIQLDVQKRVIIEHDYIYKVMKQPLLLETVLEQFKNKGLMEIELKGFELALVNQVTQVIKKFNLSNYSLTSSVLPLLSYVRKALPKARVGAILKPYLFESWMDKNLINKMTMGYLNLTGANMANLYPEQYNKFLINSLKKEGFLVHGHIYTDKKEEYDKLVTLGFDSCTFDNINLLKNLQK